MKKKYSTAPEIKLVGIDPYNDVVIDSIDIEKIQAAVSYIDHCHNIYPDLYCREERRALNVARDLLNEVIKNINNSIKTKPANKYVDTED